MKRDSLGDRMKTYENTSKNYLTRRLPAIIRLDGRSFHTFTRGMKKPFDSILMESMQETAKYLCENIQGCKIAYTQSDEISLLLVDYENLDTDAWFDNNIQKMVSISASMATLAFNKTFSRLVEKYIYSLENYNSTEDEEFLLSNYGIEVYKDEDGAVCVPESDLDLKETYKKKIMTAMFDSRVFTLPKEEVVNYFIWRQQDASRNSIQMVGQANFSHKQLHKKSCDNIQEMLFQERNINWNDIDTPKKRGACIVKEQYKLDNEQETLRSRWITDKNIPIFTQDREYIKKYV